MIKWGRTNGIRESQRERIPGGDKRCTWHQDGVPTYAMGRNWRAIGCPVCDEKLAAGKVTADAPTPAQLLEQHKAEGRAKGQRASVCARRTKARRVMSQLYLGRKRGG